MSILDDIDKVVSIARNLSESLSEDDSREFFGELASQFEALAADA